MKDKITTILFITYILFFSILHIVLKDETISETERRKLTIFPNFELNSEYIAKLDKYLLDHFPFRNNFRSIKAKYNYNVLNKLDNNDIYLKDNYIFKTNYPTNEESIDKFINNINKFKDLTNNAYIMIIPDKNYYLKDDNFLNIDYEYIYNKIEDLDIKTIDIRNILELNDYYQTDTHWKQEKLDKVVEQMSKVMNFDYEKQNYELKKFDKFHGVYYGESAINRKTETLTYLINDNIKNAEVKYFENRELSETYNIENLESLDPYEVYLDGASSFIEINNKNAKTEKELVIFRDSFSSSLAPLLIDYYSKITLIDNRYINSDEFFKLIEFKNQDIIFIYSTLIINDSSSLKG